MAWERGCYETVSLQRVSRALDVDVLLGLVAVLVLGEGPVNHGIPWGLQIVSDHGRDKLLERSPVNLMDLHKTRSINRVGMSSEQRGDRNGFICQILADTAIILSIYVGRLRYSNRYLLYKYIKR